MLSALVTDKAIKAKEKTRTICNWLLDGTLLIEELLIYAEEAKEKDKANCIEALELATKQDPTIANEKALLFVTKTLTEKAARIKWESARVIGNIAYLFPKKLEGSIVNLLANTEDKGMVVRWSCAYALGAILILNTKHNKDLLPAIEAILNWEDNSGVRNKYIEAIKKIKN